MRVPDEITYIFLFLLHLFELARLQCPAPRIVHYDIVRPTTKTPVFCAVTNANVTQRDNTKITDCSRECAHSDGCVAFNYKEPQLVCELFQTPFSNLSLTPGCTLYEVRRNQKTERQCLYIGCSDVRVFCGHGQHCGA